MTKRDTHAFARLVPFARDGVGVVVVVVRALVRFVALVSLLAFLLRSIVSDR